MSWGRRIGTANLLLLLSVLAVGLAGCSKGSEASGDEAAGKVVALSGTVTAKRSSATEPRALAIDGPIFRDDVVTTAAASSVTLQLIHNEARWDIAEKQSHQVDQSLAWKAPKGSGGTSLDERPDDRTAAAGRHSENEAAQTAGTALAPGATQTADQEGSESASAAVASTPPVEKVRAVPRKRPAKSAKSSSGASSFGEIGGLKGGDTLSSEGSGGGGPVIKEPRNFKDPKPPPPDDAPKLGSRGAPSADATRGARVSAAELIRQKLKTCYVVDGGEKAGKVQASVTIDKSGKITKVIVVAASGLEAVSACVKKKLEGRLVSPSKTGEASASVTFR